MSDRGGTDKSTFDFPQQADMISHQQQHDKIDRRVDDPEYPMQQVENKRIDDLSADAEFARVKANSLSDSVSVNQLAHISQNDSDKLDTNLEKKMEQQIGHGSGSESNNESIVKDVSDFSEDWDAEIAAEEALQNGSTLDTRCSSEEEDWDLEISKEQAANGKKPPERETPLADKRNLLKMLLHQTSSAEEDGVPENCKLLGLLRRDQRHVNIVIYPSASVLFSLRTRDNLKKFNEVQLHQWLKAVVFKHRAFFALEGTEIASRNCSINGKFPNDFHNRSLRHGLSDIHG